MPKKEVDLLDRRNLLTYGEICRIVNIFSGIGIKKVRITGGEPLLRNDLVSLIGSIRNIKNIENVSLTTNGILLKKYVRQLYDAGIDNINISLDSLDPDKFSKITRGGKIEKVISGIKEAIKYRFNQIKINVVITDLLDRGDIIEFIDFVIQRSIVVRFIELMPVTGITNIECNKNRYLKSKLMLNIGEILNIINMRGYSIEKEETNGHGPAVYYRIKEGKGKIGFIPNNVSCCTQCNRVRITPQGGIKLCLFSASEWNIKEKIRDGCTDEEISMIVLDYIKVKPLNRHKEGLKGKSPAVASYSMSKIGG